ncbi:DUF6248 family natural product biosynthesis protein [Actinomyces gaoshouyii]|uniref:DUF6248 family natural product biosynthesis protein n=1 Tax=Actinomyces gaoshouyii TaxID=1960083 RepID=UPI0009BCFC3D|nr:hypothetical protein B6G06_09055 [Actinomyces gaoshouyii]
MSERDAAWIRAHVWTPRMRKTYRKSPVFRTSCPCYDGPCFHCRRGAHRECTFECDDQRWHKHVADMSIGWIVSSRGYALDPEIWEAGVTHRGRCSCHDRGHRLPGREYEADLYAPGAQGTGSLFELLG